MSALEEASMPFYALGLNLAREVGGELKQLLTKEEIEIVLQGFGESMRGEVADPMSVLVEHGPKLNEILGNRTKEKSAAVVAEGQAFIDKYLTDNATARKTSSGLIVHETVVGTGKQASLDDTVVVHYHGTLTDGSVFDSSVNRGKPSTFPLRNVIKGWQEGVALLKEGGKATLVCPAHLAYGERGSPPKIAPGSVLRFDVELVEVKG